VGTLATVHKIVRMPNQSRFVFTEGVERVRLLRYVQTEPFMIAEVEVLEETEPATTPGAESAGAQRDRPVPADCQRIADALRRVADDCRQYRRTEPPGGFVALSLPFLTPTTSSSCWRRPAISTRLANCSTRHLAKEIEVQQLRTKIQTEVQDQVQAVAARYYLREQLKAIQKELGEQDEGQREIDELRQKIEAAGMPDRSKRTR